MALTSSLEHLALFNADLLIEADVKVVIAAVSDIEARRLALGGFLDARSFDGEPVEYVLLRSGAREVDTRLFEVAVTFGFDAADYFDVTQSLYWFAGKTYPLYFT